MQRLHARFQDRGEFGGHTGRKVLPRPTSPVPAAMPEMER